MSKNIVYRKAGNLTCFSVLLILLLGALVRSSGSGMGCPDWPKCFGLLVPPTCECKLPPNYIQIYTQKRIEKVERFVKLLHAIGAHEKAEQIRNNPEVYKPEKFNATKAWIEWINRLAGAVAGVFTLLYFVLSFRFLGQKRPKIFIASVIATFLIFFNAWLGSVVVTTNLLTGLVTTHFLLTFFALALIIYTVQQTRDEKIGIANKFVRWVWAIPALLMFLQIVFGTWVRENIEHVTGTNYYKVIDPNLLDYSFLLHRILAFTLFAFSIFLYFKKSNALPTNYKRLHLLTVALLGLQILSGSLNILLNFPLLTQVWHITLSGVIFTFQMYICTVKIKTP